MIYKSIQNNIYLQDEEEEKGKLTVKTLVTKTI